MSCRRMAFRTALILAVAWLGLVGPQALGQEKRTTLTAGPYSGTVLDPAGKPLPGVKVRLLGGSFEVNPVTMLEATTDEKGRFQIREAQWQLEARSRPPSLFARDSRGRIGGSFVVPRIFFLFNLL